MRLSWKRLEKTEIDKILHHVKSEKFDSLFKDTAQIEVSVAALPFYANFFLYKFTTYATMPSLSIEFLSNGELFYVLDGAPDPIYLANQAAPLMLNKGNVQAYLDFFFDKVDGTEGDITLLFQIGESPLSVGLSPTMQQRVIDDYTPTKIDYVSDESSSQFDYYNVVTPCYFEGTLVEATIAVYLDGALDLRGHRMLIGIYGFDAEAVNEYGSGGYGNAFDTTPYY